MRRRERSILTVEADDLGRFVLAQDAVYRQALGELQAGRKATHWMWFVFPQLRGLGSSAMAVRYGIGSLSEAAAYLAHPVLGRRLEECSGVVAAIEGRSALEVFGAPDELKLRSCMTLFSEAAGASPVFGEVLARFFGGERDGRTLALLAGG